MYIIKATQCPHCEGGTLAAELDGGMARVVCINCGRGTWLELPKELRTYASEPVERQEYERHSCSDCQADISDRHWTTLRCTDCNIKHQKERHREQQREARRLGLLPVKPRERRYCSDCEADISTRHGLAVRCVPCANLEQAAIAKRRYHRKKEVAA